MITWMLCHLRQKDFWLAAFDSNKSEHPTHSPKCHIAHVHRRLMRNHDASPTPKGRQHLNSLADGRSKKTHKKMKRYDTRHNQDFSFYLEKKRYNFDPPVNIVKSTGIIIVICYGNNMYTNTINIMLSDIADTGILLEPPDLNYTLQDKWFSICLIIIHNQSHR